MSNDSQQARKERFDALIDDVVSAGLFLEQAVEILERGMLQRALSATGGNQCEAAKLLGIHRNTLQRKMDAYEIDGKRTSRKPASRAHARTAHSKAS